MPAFGERGRVGYSESIWTFRLQIRGGEMSAGSGTLHEMTWLGCDAG